jgi:hypothetical protein
MQSYNFKVPPSSTETDGSARPPDERLEAFADLLESVDRSDWRAGQAATKRLRAMGFSVVLVKPPGDRRGA